MADVWSPLQTAVVSAVTGNAAFTTATSVSRDDGGGSTGAQYYVAFIPDWATYPYADTPGDAFGVPWYEFSGGSGEEIVWPVHIWCDLQHGGPAKCRSVSKAVDGVLDQSSFSVTGFNNMLFQRIHSTLPMRQQGDPTLYHQVLRYRVMLQTQP